MIPPRRLAVLLALMALAFPAVAQPRQTLPSTKPQAAMPVPADIPGPACLPSHRQVFTDAVATARRHVTAALVVLRDQPDHPEVQRWFGNAPRDEVRGRLKMVAAWFIEQQVQRLECNDPPACKDSRMAYAAAGRGLLGLCPAFFRASLTGFDSRWGILVHEVSHLVAGTRDHAYGRRAALALATNEPGRAAENADNYEYFVETLASR
ncbi:M35 family metallopeptidase [Falsiroseomonas sp. HW251]|uniref:M35 family metallopeptidase n=1 Tax=Falsiroseomonas sp. HW251 TaxID=3390998 RepID=UPI003D3195AD